MVEHGERETLMDMGKVTIVYATKPSVHDEGPRLFIDHVWEGPPGSSMQMDPNAYLFLGTDSNGKPMGTAVGILGYTRHLNGADRYLVEVFPELVQDHRSSSDFDGSSWQPLTIFVADVTERLDIFGRLYDFSVMESPDSGLPRVYFWRKNRA